MPTRSASTRATTTRKNSSPPCRSRTPASPPPAAASASAASTSPGGGQLAADEGGDLGAEELDRAHHVGVGEGADAELDEEAVVVEDRVLGEDLLGDLGGGADEVGAFGSAARFEGGAAHRRPASLAADPVHHPGEGREGEVGGLL